MYFFIDLAKMYGNFSAGGWGCTNEKAAPGVEHLKGLDLNPRNGLLFVPFYQPRQV